MSTVYKRDPQRGWRTWHMEEIYVGNPPLDGKPLYVPNVKDVVFDGVDTYYRVDAIDSVTSIPTLTMFDPSARFCHRDVDPDSLHEGLKMFQPHIATRIFVDNATTPATLTPASHYKVHGCEFTSMKFFKGTDTSENGTVVSQVINSNGAVVSEEVDLQPIIAGNNAIKRPVKCNTTQTLVDGEIVTGVVYTTMGTPAAEHSFIVRNAAMIAGPEASNVYIEDIELISSLIDDNDPLLLNNQLGVPFNTAAMNCRIHYSDGGFKDVAIDGAKAKLHQLSNFNTNLLGPETRVVLSYYPGSQEQSINLTGTTPSINKTYRLRNLTQDENHGFKLYVVPYWTGTEYVLNVRLTDVDYAIDMDVTAHTTIKQANNWDFNSIGFGLTQSLVLTVALDDVLPGAYQGYVHTQTLKLTLAEPNSTDQDNWVIDYLADGHSVFGVGTYALYSTTTNKAFSIACGQVGEYEWLSHLYYSIDPIFDNALAGEPPKPTHFRLEHGGEAGTLPIGTYPLSQWNKTFALGEDREWELGWPLTIVWLVVAGEQEKVVGITPLSLELDV